MIIQKFERSFRMTVLLQTLIHKKKMQKTRALIIENGQHKNETLMVTLETRGVQVFSVELKQEGSFVDHIPAPDIIILDSDVQLSDCSAIIRKIRAFSPAPILVLSTLDQPNVIAQTLDCGADDFLTKPVSPDVLMACINKLTRRAQTNLSS
jgi:two-component system, OmpR family, KDP operon response regulator KdpE